MSVSDNLGYNGVNVFKEGGVILTSVEEADNNFTEFIIAPNPASDFIEINLNNEASLIASDKVHIFDILGLEVGQSSLIDGNNRINISHLPAGVYYIRIGNKVEKFLKM